MIEVQNVYLKYPKEDYLFDNIDFKINQGETVGLIGSNGAGKSTLLKMLVGICHYQKGQVIIDKVKLEESSIKEIRGLIGYSFQDTDSQLFMPSVYEDVAFGPMNQKIGKEEVHQRAMEALTLLDIVAIKDKPPYKLSGGEKRLATLATLLSMKPKVLLLDEPTTGLDPRARRRFIDIINHLEQTIIIATHDMNMAMELCDRLLVFHEGKIVASDVPKKIFKNIDLMKTCHIEVPEGYENRHQECPSCGYNF